MTRKDVGKYADRFRIALLTGAIAVAGSSIVFNQLAAKDKPSNPPVRVDVDPTPMVRGGDRLTSFAPVVKSVAPSIVTVFTTTKPKETMGMENPFGNNPMLRRFFGDNPQFNTPRGFVQPEQNGLGSGVIVSADGYILTNNHVVERADEIRVAFNGGGREYEARVVGGDPKTDIAVLRIDAKDLPHVTFGDSDQIEIGDLVLAIGNPFGIGQTVTMGMISATGRAHMGLDYEDFIQTDAAINPGNSGGALVDAEGRLIGINTAILSRSGGNNGIGFAVPVNLARHVMNNLVENGRVIRGFLGVNIQDLTPELAKAFSMDNPTGALVAQVTPDSAAEEAGIKSGDVIVSFDGDRVRDSRDLKLRVGQALPGNDISLVILRDGQEKKLSARLKAMPTEPGLAAREHGTERQSEALGGLRLGDLTPAIRARIQAPANVRGAIVIGMTPDAAAREAGLRDGDVIMSINRQSIENADEAIAAIADHKGSPLLLHVWSRGGSRYIVVEQGELG